MSKSVMFFSFCLVSIRRGQWVQVKYEDEVK